jgi:tRNA pseudouridine38-40 synthase
MRPFLKVGGTMRNICMVVSYDGTAYYGFQTQPGGNTIQDKIESAIRSLTGETVSIIGSGRTDAGVHALGQVFNFKTESRIPVERWCLALNSWLPDDIVVLSAREVPPDFHARYAAKRKTYRYTINTNRFPDVVHRRFQLHHPAPLDLNAMREALQFIVGEHDFTSFTSTKSPLSSHVRTIYEAEIATETMQNPNLPDPGEVIHIYLTGNGFLYNMVRIIVGTLIEIGEGKRKSSEMTEILAARDRSCAGPTAMAHGLMLWKVEYDEVSAEMQRFS